LRRQQILPNTPQTFSASGEPSGSARLTLSFLSGPLHFQLSQRLPLRQVDPCCAWQILVIFDFQVALGDVPEFHKLLGENVEPETPIGEPPAGIVFAFSDGHELFLSLNLNAGDEREVRFLNFDPVRKTSGILFGRTPILPR